MVVPRICEFVIGLRAKRTNLFLHFLLIFRRKKCDIKYCRKRGKAWLGQLVLNYVISQLVSGRVVRLCELYYLIIKY